MNNEQQKNLNQQDQDDINNEGQGTQSDAIYLNDSSLQTKSEAEQDKKEARQKKEDTIVSSGVDDLQSNSDGAAGTDRAGTAERKTYGDIELNKGLEAQAKDEES